MPKISQAILSSVSIPYCDLRKQEEIVQRIEERFSLALALELSTEEQLSKSEALRYSILRQAFLGKLVVQDYGDGSTSVLLERITEDSGRRKNTRNGRKEAA